VRGRGIARIVARATKHPEWEQPLDGAVGFLARRSDRGLTFLGAGFAAAAGAALWLLAMLQPRLVMETEPLAEVTLAEAFHVYTLIVQPRVSVRNGFGRALRLNLPVTMTVPNALVRGDSVVMLRGGLHQFERLLVERDPALPPPLRADWHITARGPWWVRGTSARIGGSGAADLAHGFRAVSLRVTGGELIDTMHVRARLGDSLRFDLTFEYSTTLSTANYVVAGTPTWGERRASVIRLGGLPSPVERAWQTVTFSVPPPPGPGMHHVVIVLGLEDEAANVLSSTNWAVGEPVWYDGNDVVDLPPSAFETLRRTGLLTIPEYLHRFYQGRLPDVRLGDTIIRNSAWNDRPGRRPQNHSGIAIRIDVVPR
jgi:hypothetical protein